MGVTEPEATFSPCFGGPFLVWHPGRYAELLRQRIETHKSNVWLVNTGWSGGAYGTGKRMKLAFTRAIVDGIHTGALADAPVVEDPQFGFEVITRCPRVPDSVLLPRSTWADPALYDKTAKKLAALFKENFRTYEAGVSAEVRAAGARV
jgi:phosphoenolpyruvate carboxykinase (ATP)